MLNFLIFLCSAELSKNFLYNLGTRVFTIRDMFKVTIWIAQAFISRDKHGRVVIVVRDMSPNIKLKTKDPQTQKEVYTFEYINVSCFAAQV